MQAKYCTYVQRTEYSAHNAKDWNRIRHDFYSEPTDFLRWYRKKKAQKRKQQRFALDTLVWLSMGNVGRRMRITFVALVLLVATWSLIWRFGLQAQFNIGGIDIELDLYGTSTNSNQTDTQIQMGHTWISADATMARDANYVRAHSYDQPACTPTQLDYCVNRTSECEKIVIDELAKSFSPMPICASDSSSRSRSSSAASSETKPCITCTPKQIRYACSEVRKNTSRFACVKDLYVDEYDYATQHACIRAIAERVPLENTNRVPRIGHSVYFYGEGSEVKLNQYLSIVSSMRYLKPAVYFIWNDGLPSGKWWLELLVRVQSPNATSRMISLTL